MCRQAWRRCVNLSGRNRYLRFSVLVVAVFGLAFAHVFFNFPQRVGSRTADPSIAVADPVVKFVSPAKTVSPVEIKIPPPLDLSTINDEDGGVKKDRDAYAQWLNSQPDSVFHLAMLGVPVPEFNNVTDYLIDLERRIAEGDGEAVMPAIRLVSGCRYSLSTLYGDPLADPGNPSHEAAKICASLPKRDYDYERNLVAESARRGMVPAVLHQFLLPPKEVVRDPGSSASQMWARRVADQMTNLAVTGNAEAALVLGRFYSRHSYGLRDSVKAANFFRMYLDQAKAKDFRRKLATAELSAICARREVPVEDVARICGPGG